MPFARDFPSVAAWGGQAGGVRETPSPSLPEVPDLSRAVAEAGPEGAGACRHPFW